jgi:MFS transporter, SP family, general alpha glucoside:H+ symporter
MATEPKSDAIHFEASERGGVEHLKDVGLHDIGLASGALEGTAQEHSMGVWEALKTYKRAAFWSIRTYSRLIT